MAIHGSPPLDCLTSRKSGVRVPDRPPRILLALHDIAIGVFVVERRTFLRAFATARVSRSQPCVRTPRFSPGDNRRWCAPARWHVEGHNSKKKVASCTV